MSNKFVNWEVIDPMASITKVGAGARLHALIFDKDTDRIVAIPVAKITLREVVELADMGIKFIEIKED